MSKEKKQNAHAAVSLQEPLVSSLLPKVLTGNRTLRPQRGGDGLCPTREKARTEGDVWPAIRNAGWGGVHSWPAPKGRVAGKADVKRPVKTPCNEKKEKIAICPQLAVAFKQRHSEACFGAPTLGYRSRDAIGQSSTLLRAGRADLATL